MSQATPIVTFRASVATKAPADAVYAVLADLSTHLDWAGERSVDKNFRLLTLDAPLSSATVGDHFSSTGSNILSMKFFDSSVVVEAERGKRFVFDTESRLERKHRPTWRARFVNRYEITPTGGGATLSYSSEVWPQNYTPWWLSPALRPMMRVMVPRSMRKNMETLVSIAESALPPSSIPPSSIKEAG